MIQKFHGGGGGEGGGKKTFSHVSPFGESIYLRCQLWKAFTIQHLTLMRLIIFMVFSVSVRGILVLGKFIV